MVHTYRFWKDKDSRWWVDLPTWEGPIEDLEMVCGADKLCEIMAQGDEEVRISFSEKPFEGSKIKMIKGKFESAGYWYYFYYNLFDMANEAWLCHVTKHVFGHFPKTIYIS